MSERDENVDALLEAGQNFAKAIAETAEGMAEIMRSLTETLEGVVVACENVATQGFDLPDDWKSDGP